MNLLKAAVKTQTFFKWRVSQLIDIIVTIIILKNKQKLSHVAESMSNHREKNIMYASSWKFGFLLSTSYRYWRHHIY